jgi:hypothetical protein
LEVALGAGIAALATSVAWALLVRPGGVYVSLGNDLPMWPGLYLSATSFIAVNCWWVLIVGLTLTFVVVAFLKSEPGARVRQRLSPRRIVLTALVVLVIVGGLLTYANSVITGSSDLVL